MGFQKGCENASGVNPNGSNDSTITAMNRKFLLLLAPLFFVPGTVLQFAWAQIVEKSAPEITDRGLDSRTWEWVVEKHSASGEIISEEKHGYIELASPAQRFDEFGQNEFRYRWFIHRAMRAPDRVVIRLANQRRSDS